MKLSDTTHPSHDDLFAYLAGKLNAVDSESIEAHLNQCESCCEVLSAAPTEDTIDSMLRQKEADTSISPETPAAQDESPREDGIAPTIVPESVEETRAPRGEVTAIPGLDAAALKLPLELREHPRYRIVELLGHGGMGDVYRAEHKVMSRQVALKVIKPQLVQNDAAVRRFQREVKAAARLHHSNIVTAYDAEQAGDLHYLVMEFVDGEDLDEVIRERGPLPVDEACEYIRQTAEGLQYAHELGMVHRDIKPHNLMVVKSRESRDKSQEPELEVSSSSSGLSTLDSQLAVKILDFGLANFANEVAEDVCSDRIHAVDEPDESGHYEPVPGASILHQLTQMGTMMGTPDYIAPEQAQDAHTADIRSDIYSLGCTFYTLLTGKAPFGEGSVMDKIKAHTHEDAPPLSDFRDDVPAEVEAILNKMMAKDPAERYQTPAEVAAALAAVERLSRVVKKDADDSGESSDRKRRPLILTAVATLFLALLAAVATIFYIQTDNGVVRVEVTDPSLNVTISGRTITMNDGEKPLTIRAGDQKLIVRQKDSDFELVTDSFQLRRGDDIVLKVELRPGEVVVSKNGERMGAKALSDQHSPTDPIVSEWAQLAGLWRAKSGSLDGVVIDPADARKTLLFVDPSDRSISFVDDGRVDSSVSVIRPTTDQKQIDVTTRGNNPTVKGRLGIYELDNAWLTICLAAPGRPRPTALHANADAGGGSRLLVFARVRSSASEFVQRLVKNENLKSEVKRSVEATGAEVVSDGGSSGTAGVLRYSVTVDTPTPRFAEAVVEALKKNLKWSGATVTHEESDGQGHTALQYSFSEVDGVLRLSLASFDADSQGGGTSRLDIAIDEWPKWERPSKNEIRLVFGTEERPGSNPTVEIPGVLKTEKPEEALERIREIVAENPQLVVVVDVSNDLDPRDFDKLFNADSVRKMVAGTGAAVRFAPRLLAVLHPVDPLLQERRRNQLKQIGLGLLSFEEQRRFLPPGKVDFERDWFDENGRPHLSWRVHILPYIEREELYRAFKLNEPWDSPHNKPLLAEMPPQFRTTEDTTRTSMLTVVGNGTAYEGKGGLPLTDFTDGTANTVLVVDAGRERAVPWTKPEDLPFDTEDPIRTFGTSVFGNQFLALMADGSVSSIPYDTAPESLRALFTRAAGDKFDETAKRTTPLRENPLPGPKPNFDLQLHGHHDVVVALRFLPDGKKFVSVSRDRRIHTCVLAEQSATKQSTQSSSLASEGTIGGAAISPDGRLAAVTWPELEMLEIWEASNQSGAALKRLKTIRDQHASARKVIFSPDSKKVLTAVRYRPVLWDVMTGEQLTKFPHPFLLTSAAAISRDGKLVALAAADEPDIDGDRPELAILRSDGKLVRNLEIPSPSGVCQLAFSSSGSRLAVGQDDGTITIFDVESGKAVESFPHRLAGRRSVSHIEFRNDDQLLVAAVDSQFVRFWNVSTKQLVFEAIAPPGAARELCFSPDGRTLVTGGGERWDEKTGKFTNTGNHALYLWRLPENLWPEE